MRHKYCLPTYMCERRRAEGYRRARAAIQQRELTIGPALPRIRIERDEG